MERQRLFISLDLPEAVKKAAEAVQERLRKTQAHVSWTRTEGMHLTLKFLGEVDARQVHEIQAMLEKASQGFQPMTVRVEGLGGFPTDRAPRVIWLGIEEPSGELARLKKRLDQALTPLGFPLELRVFHPHLTLGRVKSPKGREALVKSLKEIATVHAGEWVLEELALVRSVLQTGGAVYTKLWTFKAAA